MHLANYRVSSCLLTNLIAVVTSSLGWHDERHRVFSYMIMHLSSLVSQPLAQGQPL